MIDHTRPVPLHYQVRQFVLDRLETGQWAVGSQIPTEQQLSALFRVSRATVVRALTELVRDGILERRQGKGTFVASPRLLHGPFELKSFTEEHSERGLVAHSQVLECREEPGSATVCERLRIAVDEPVIRLRRLRWAGRDTMGIQEAFLPAARVPNFLDHRDLLTGSLYQLLQSHYHLEPHRAIETFEPIVLDDEAAALLKGPSNRLAFLVERVTFDAAGQPMEYVQSKMRGDRYRYSMELLRH